MHAWPSRDIHHHTLVALSCRAENWEKNGNKTASADQKLHLMGAGLCSELSCEFGSWRQWKIRVGGKAEVAAAVPRGWFGIWALVLLWYQFWSGQGCVISQN